MDFNLLVWLFAIAITVHNLEESIWLPRWSKSAGRWHHPVEPGEFRFAVAALTVFAYAAACLAFVGGRESAGAYLISGYALAMLINVVFPHLVATVALRRYAPGVATALVLNLPVTFFLLRQAIAEKYVRPDTFIWAGPLVVVCILVSIPVLFALGRWKPLKILKS
ncbi:MAG: HXXEE domain-containing protein [Thermodesulfobacteriota bacterium]